MSFPDLDSIRFAIATYREAVIAHGQQAFVQENPAEARANADRLDKLQVASRALADLESALDGFASFESVEPADGEKRVVTNHRVLRPEAEGAEIHLNCKGISAKGRLTGEEVMVQAGSTMVLSPTPACPGYVLRKRDELISLGQVVREAKCYRFKVDVTFPSPSNAAMVLLGRTANGRLNWCTADGRSIGEKTPR